MREMVSTAGLLSGTFREAVVRVRWEDVQSADLVGVGSTRSLRLKVRALAHFQVGGQPDSGIAHLDNLRDFRWSVAAFIDPASQVAIALNGLRGDVGARSELASWNDTV
jgi:hypothetical protein